MALVDSRISENAERLNVTSPGMIIIAETLDQQNLSHPLAVVGLSISS